MTLGSNIRDGDQCGFGHFYAYAPTKIEYAIDRWTDAIAKRPAVQRGRMVNRINGDPASQLRERHEASDFDTKTQDKVAAAG
jgi:hypothetical protein